MDHSYVEDNNVAELYLMGKLSESDRAGFEMHFIDCERCIALLDETQNLREGLAAHWKAGKEPELPVRGVVAWLGRFGPWQQTGLIAAAAILLLSLPAIFFFSEIRGLRRELAELGTRKNGQPQPPSPSLPGNQNVTPAPPSPDQNPARATGPASDLAQVNIPIFTLSSVRSDTLNEVKLDRTQKRFVVSLDIEGSADYIRYRVKIAAASGRNVWQGSNLRRNQYDALTIGFSSDLLKPGRYTLELDGYTKAGGIERVAIYPFRVVTTD
jgi:hypothetical protein